MTPETAPVQVLDVASVERELDGLEAAGARGYDPLACDCVRALLTRAEELGGGVGERLVARALSHVGSLRQRFEADRQRALSHVESVEQLHGEQPELRRTLERGEVVRVCRVTRRLSSRPPPRRLPEYAGQEPSAPPPRDRHAVRRKRAVVYEDSVAALVASFALARAVDVVPEDAGPYNPLRIASEALDRMREVSPFYLTVQLNRLEELASLLTLPDLPAPPEEKVQKVLPKKKRGSLKSGS